MMNITLNLTEILYTQYKKGERYKGISMELQTVTETELSRISLQPDTATTFIRCNFLFIDPVYKNNTKLVEIRIEDNRQDVKSHMQYFSF